MEEVVKNHVLSAKQNAGGKRKMGNFGSKHLTGLLWVFTLIIIFLCFTLILRKKKHLGEKFDLRVFQSAALFIWILEIIKTIYIFRSPDYGDVGEYTAYMLPFHICSMGLYAFWILGFHPGKFADFIKPFSFAVLLIVTSIVLTIPDSSGILGDYHVVDWSFTLKNTLPFQSFLYHGTLVFVPLYMVLSGYYKPRIKDVWKAAVVLLSVAVVAFILNKLLMVTDFMTLEFGWGNPFAYLIADHYALYFLILASVTIGGTAIVLGIAQLIQKLCAKKTN